MPEPLAAANERPLRHLLVCREYPPAPYPAGGIGSYARHIARLLAEAGETVHVVTQRWAGAPHAVEQSHDGKLTVHRILLHGGEDDATLRALAASDSPSQVFAWAAASYCEKLIEDEAIDVIEAQEWEAPLYFLLLRRRLGTGHARQPPCLVHLHSPTSMIFRHNGWDTSLVDVEPLVRCEEFTIRAADALVCPSRHLARLVAEELDLPAPGPRVIRLPLGDAPLLERSEAAWECNAVCFVGRLELRKGVLEWIDAAVRVARSEATVSFDFFGSDTPVDGGAGESVQALLERRIPRELRGRFRFHGPQPREVLREALAACSLAVIPSRWENLPFTCLEAMASGMPVLITPHGGMAELIEDGVTGWVAAETSAEALADGLRRALATPAAERKAMGLRAAAAVREQCGNGRVLRDHLELRRELVAAGAGQSGAFAGGSTAELGARSGWGIVAIARGDASQKTLAMDTIPQVPVRCEAARDAAKSGAAIRSGVSELLSRHPLLAAVAVLEASSTPEREVLERAVALLEREPSLGAVSGWTVDGDGVLWTRPLSPVVTLSQSADLPAGCIYRAEALTGSAKPWATVTLPEVMLHTRDRAGRRRFSGMTLIQNHSVGFALGWFLALPWPEKLCWLRRGVRNRARLLPWLRWQTQRGKLPPSPPETNGETKRGRTA